MSHAYLDFTTHCLNVERLCASLEAQRRKLYIRGTTLFHVIHALIRCRNIYSYNGEIRPDLHTFHTTQASAGNSEASSLICIGYLAPTDISLN